MTAQFHVAAAIFDMDGVLVDSVPIHRQAWEKVAARLGKPFTHEMFQLGNGRTALSHVLALNWTECHVEGQQLAEEKEATYRRLVEELGVKAVEGVKTFLDQVTALGIPCAVGTSAPGDNQHMMLRMTGLEGYFKVFVNSDDVKAAKPAPDIFLRAAQCLGTAPVRCVVFEDAPLGIQAAKAAGMKVVALSLTHPPDELREADIVVSSFAELSVSELFSRA